MEAITAPSTSFYAVSTFLLISMTFHLNGTTSYLSSAFPAPFYTFLYFLETDMRYSQSLEPRPRSIYDVLDRSAVNTGPDQRKDKPKKKKPQNTVSANLRCFVTFSVENNETCSDLSYTSSTDDANHTTPK